MKNHNRIHVNLTLLINGLQTYIFLLSEIIIYKLYIFVSCYIILTVLHVSVAQMVAQLVEAPHYKLVPMVSMKFFIDIILLAALWPWD